IENADRIKSKLEEQPNDIIIEVKNIKYNDPIFTFVSMRDLISDEFHSNDYNNILIDITAFTHEHLLMILKIVSEYKQSNMNIQFCYASAKNYGVDLENYEDMWLTKGISDIRSIIGYPGFSDPTKRNHLMIIMGFEKERVTKVIEKFEYDEITLCIGSEHASVSKEMFLINQKICDSIIDNSPSVHKYMISLTDIEDAKNQLEAYLRQKSEFNNVIIPMNNKISTIAAGLLAIENKDIQICYVSADEYNQDNYSKAGEKFYLFSQIGNRI
ncbi:hypothetical protein, partial [Anaerosolibacter sp.]|uniref:hypothetical protein n=1 Tax=Anaerosolibacter sp. TaxID=1872527 RepID=UPI0039F09922